MPRRSYDEFEYDDDEYTDSKRGPRKFKLEDKDDKKRKAREEYYDRDHDYDERR